MMDTIIISILLICSFGGTYYVRQLALKKSIIDIPNERSSHLYPTPRGGGLSIAMSWYIFLLVWYFIGKIELRLFLALVTSIILVVVSFIDDIKNVSPGIRFLSQMVTSIIGLAFLKGLHHIDIGFTHLIIPLALNIIVVLGMIWMINVFNFLDGIDGYLGAESSFIFISLFLLTGDFLGIAFAAIIFGFLLWNWPKAKIFCGDVGSTLIGYTLMIFAIHYQNSNQLSFIIPILLSGLFWVDATVTLIRRLYNKEKISEAHKKHAYQRLTQAGFSHQRVLIIGIIINFCSFLLAFFSKIHSSYILPAFLLQIMMVLLFIKYADLKYAFKR